MDILGKRFQVPGMGDQGWIELQDLLPHPSTEITPDQAIVNAARTSYLGESKGDVQDHKLLDYLYRNNHTSPFEMVEFKFRVRAPLVTFWQWVRHRTWSFNLQSGRYTPFEENDFYIPESWRKQSTTNHQGSSDETFTLPEQRALWVSIFNENGFIGEQFNIPDFWDDRHIDEDRINMSELLTAWCNSSYIIYQKLLERGAAKEQARLFLPGFALYYTMVAKVDLHNLLHFLRLRMADEAQYEIRSYAQTIYDQIVKPLCPWTAEAFEKYQSHYVLTASQQ